MKISLTLLISVFILSITSYSYCGTITTNIICDSSISENYIRIKAKIQNSGDDTAHAVNAFVFVDSYVEQYNLGDNPPSGELNFNSEFKIPNLKPGHYTIIIRVHFEEQNGAPHRTYHISTLDYKKESKSNINSKLLLNVTSPAFNTKAFWHKEDSFKVSLTNGYQNPLTTSIMFFLPDGFVSLKGISELKLMPSEQKSTKIPFALKAAIKQTNRYHTILWYEQDNIHYSHHIEGNIDLFEEPVYFKWYLGFSACLLIVVALSWWLLARSSWLVAGRW